MFFQTMLRHSSISWTLQIKNYWKKAGKVRHCNKQQLHALRHRAILHSLVQHLPATLRVQDRHLG